MRVMPHEAGTLHFVGIGGIGMSGLARILTMWGHKVTGSDAVESAQTESLRAMGIPILRRPRNALHPAISSCAKVAGPPDRGHRASRRPTRTRRQA